MDLIDFQFTKEYNHRKKIARYSKNNLTRRLKRLNIKQVSRICSSKVQSNCPSSFCEQAQPVKSDKINVSQPLQYVPNVLSEEFDCDNTVETVNIPDELSSNESEKQDLSSIHTPLHKYTLLSTYDYCESFATVTRAANLSKKSTHSLLSLIKSGLPIPNELPATEQELIDYLGVEELFSKHSICLLCYNELDYYKQICSQCGSLTKDQIAYM